MKITPRRLGKLLLHAVAPQLPLTMGRLPYAAALRAIKALLRHSSGKNPPQVWPRNSYLSQTFQPGISDLDLTIWFPARPDKAQIRNTSQLLKIVRAAFPLLGEINAYEPSMKSTAAEFANPFALQRDPKLAEMFAPGIHRSPGNAAAAFLLRALDADSENLARYPESRREKWAAHFMAVGVKSVNFSDSAQIYENILEAVANVTTGAHSVEATQRTVIALRKYFASSAQTKRDGFYGFQNEFHFLLPHRYCYLPNVAPPKSEWQRSVIVAQLAWEITGLLGQCLFSPNRPALLEHVDKLSAFTRNTTDDASLINGFQFLRRTIAELSH